MKRADAHDLAIIAVGTAATLDPRVTTHDRVLIGELASGILDAGMNPSREELVGAVKAHYEATEHKVTWASLLQFVRAARRAKLLAEEHHPDPGLRERQRLDFLDFKEAIESWPCPTCDAPTGWPCMSQLTGAPLAFASHPKRARLALGPPPPRVPWTGPPTEREHAVRTRTDLAEDAR